MKNLLIFILFHSFISTTYAQLGYIPDDNFEQSLIDLGYDVGPLDDSVEIAIVSEITSLNLSSKDIVDLTGIKYFSSLREFHCDNNPISVINLNHNTELEKLEIGFGPLSSVDLSENIRLEELIIGTSPLSELDLSQNTELVELNIFEVSISELDLTANVLLETLHCSFNSLTEIDLSNNIELTNLQTSFCSLSELNLENNTLLEVLFCPGNELTNLELEANTRLKKLSVSGNHLTTLDLTHNTLLEKVNLFNNQLTKLNLKNGNNPSIINFSAFDNPDLTCIQVDDAAWSTTNWTEIDEDAEFNENCYLSVHEVSDFTFEIYPNPTCSRSTITMNTPCNYVLVNMNGKHVSQGYFNQEMNILDLGELPTGIYFLKLNNGSSEHVSKVVKL